MVRGEKLITPALTDAVLESITRDSVIQLARSMGFEVQERTIDRTELYTADEAFLFASIHSNKHNAVSFFEDSAILKFPLLSID